MTLDPKGHVVVSGRGYVRLLLDDNRDGRADRALDFAGAPKDGAMGLFWEGDSLFCMGDGGLRRYRDANGEGRKHPLELLYSLKTGGEHNAHAMRRGPTRYRTTQIATAAGKVYQGLIVYEAVDSVILQTGPAETIRLTNPQVRERRLTSLSLMPFGLLDRLGGRDIADLYAYLKSLAAPQNATSPSR